MGHIVHMRVLLTTTPDHGRLFPMVPLAWALRCAGHQVLVTGPESIAPAVHGAGLEHAPAVPDQPRRTPPHADVPDREELADHHVALAEVAAAQTVDLVGQWRPDMVISDRDEHAGPIAAALSGTPSAVHQHGLHNHCRVTDTATDRLHLLQEDFGLLPEETAPTATIDLCPPSLHCPASEENTLALRHIPYGGGGTPAPWLWAPHSQPRVCVSMGTIPGSAREECLRTLAEELSDFDGEVVLTGIETADPDSPTLPAHIRTAAWLPHDQIFPTCDVVIHHGGSGVTMNAVRFGLPQLLLPGTAEQRQNAEQMVHCGIARSVDASDRAEGLLRQEVEWLLTERAHRNQAKRVQAETGAMPAPGQVVTALEDLAVSARTHTPAMDIHDRTLVPAQ